MSGSDELHTRAGYTGALAAAWERTMLMVSVSGSTRDAEAAWGCGFSSLLLCFRGLCFEPFSLEPTAVLPCFAPTILSLN